MSPNHQVIVGLGIALLVVACAPSATEVTEEDRSAITALSEGYLQALVDDDVDALASLFVEDGIRLVNGGEAMRGRSVILGMESLTPTGNPAGDFLSFRTSNITVGGEGDLAHSWLDYDLVSVASDGAEPSTTYGRFLNVARRQSDGAWLFVAVMFNVRPAS